jgi:pSer/pThr/pTyr-binding forkhead associated (FHA) protein
MAPSRKSFDPLPTVVGKKKRLPEGLGAIVEFTDGAERGRVVPLLFERTILGRKSGEILVRDILVSAAHLGIEYLNGAFRVTDLGSSNGTFVGGKPVREMEVREGEEIRIGECAFCLRLDPARAARLIAQQPVHESEGKSGLADLLRREFFGAEGGTVLTRLDPPSATRFEIHLRVVSGADSGKRFSFSKPSIIIGRMNADLSLEDPDVSRKHAMLERGERGEVILRDLASANGTQVNRRPVANCVLAIGDRIGVGKTTLIFLGAGKE